MRFRYILSLLFLLFCMAFTRTSNAQDAFREYVNQDGWSIGMHVGLADLWGDIGTKSMVTHYTNNKYFDKVAVIGGLFGRYSIHPCLAVRLQLGYGTLYATDKWNSAAANTVSLQGDDAYQRYARAQNVKDYIFEGTVLFELNFMRFNPESHNAAKRGQPFLALGFTYFHFTPYSTVGNSSAWVAIHDLNLEGQGWGNGYPKQYKLWQPAIPIAFGYKWDLGQHINFGIEYMYRYTFTDYLDGVSGKYVDPAEYQKHMSASDAVTAQQVADKGYYLGLAPKNTAGNLRGNASNKDAYSTITFTLAYKINTNTRRWW
jgi:Domain of unknown function (DUF6089)